MNRFAKLLILIFNFFILFIPNPNKIENPSNKSVNKHLERLKSFTKEEVPDVVKQFGDYEPALKVYADLLEANFKNGNIPTLTKQMILLSIVNARGAENSGILTSHICKVAGVQEDMLKVLSEDLSNLSDDLTGSVIKFGVKSAVDSAHIVGEDYDKLRKLGLDNTEIMEIVSLSAFANYMITLSETLKTA